MPLSPACVAGVSTDCAPWSPSRRWSGTRRTNPARTRTRRRIPSRGRTPHNVARPRTTATRSIPRRTPSSTLASNSRWLRTKEVRTPREPGLVLPFLMRMRPLRQHDGQIRSRLHQGRLRHLPGAVGRMVGRDELFLLAPPALNRLGRAPTARGSRCLPDRRPRGRGAWPPRAPRALNINGPAIQFRHPIECCAFRRCERHCQSV